MTIALIACSKTKRSFACQAEELYQGALFKKSLRYAKYKYDKVFILSAKYGLLPLTSIVDPYEKTLNKMLLQERKAWARQVRRDLPFGNYIYFAGRKYREFLPSGKIPLLRLPLGEQLRKLNRLLEEEGLL